MFRRLADFVLGIVARLLFKLEIMGLDNVPAQGPFIAAMNHIYFADPVLVGTLAPRLIIIIRYKGRIRMSGVWYITVINNTI